MNLKSVIAYIKSPWFWPRVNGWLLGKRYPGNASTARIYNGVYLTPEFIRWCDNVLIYKNCRIEGVVRYAGKEYSPEIILHENVTIQQNAHITCARRIEIGANTAIASNVTITDIEHGYEDPDTPVELQPLEVSEVIIGEDCKIYNNAVILKGSVLGKHCVVGANSVVKGKFPDYSVIVGIPARCVRRYDAAAKSWRKTDKDGSFI